MGKKQSAKIKQGIPIDADVYDDKGRMVGTFEFRCVSCGSRYVTLSLDRQTGHCGECGKQVAYLMENDWQKPKESPMRKVLMFDVSFGGTYIWECTVCGHDISTLASNFATTNCERCKGVTSRRKDLPIMIDGEPTWVL